MKYDFSGYATKNNIKCSDGRTIMHGAFKENDGQRVPLVWQHMHGDPGNVLGHATLENRDDGVYAYGFFNDTPAGKNSKELLKHGDIVALSIYANDLVQNGTKVVHGNIREVSLVLSGANPGALIDNVAFQHGDMVEESESEAIIYTGLELSHAGESGEADSSDSETESNKSEDTEETNSEEEEGITPANAAAIYDSMTPKQKQLVEMLLIEDDEENEEKEELKQSSMSEKEDALMHKNVFDQSEKTKASAKTTLTHSQIAEIFDDAKNIGSLKDSVLSHAVNYGIDNIDMLFPDAMPDRNTPDWIKRRTEWVAGVLGGTHHTPFSRIKSMTANITADEARAKGYIKGNLKKEEFFGLAKRITTPTTIYKKQKLDRDDIIDITSFDVVAWLKGEMRVMLDEEIARAILVGDGRQVDSEDKINENNIRPIWTDAELYAPKIDVTAGGTVAATPDALIDAVLRARTKYEGSGSPVFYTTPDVMTDILLMKDKNGRYIYDNEAAVASKLRVSKIVEVPIMENLKRTAETKNFALIGIVVNLQDYTIGADKGGQTTFFDDFDIDYNQYKYLLEARMSGALTKPNSALVIEKKLS